MMNRPVHFEIHGIDAARFQRFYESLFGWKFSKWQGPREYWLISTGDSTPGIDGGMLVSRDGNPRTVNTIEVKDVDEFLAKIPAAGGQVVVPKMAIPGVGWLGYLHRSQRKHLRRHEYRSERRLTFDGPPPAVVYPRVRPRLLRCLFMPIRPAIVPISGCLGPPACP